METITTLFKLGDAQVAGPLAVFPVFGPQPMLDYRSFSDATGLGAFVKELDEGASVNDLLVENPTDKPLLIFEGEEVLGAKQNRIFDASVLVAAGTRLKLSVSCVEQGRWDPSQESAHFEVSPAASDPSLRRVKRARANARAAAGQDARPDQGEVWDEVRSRLGRHGVDSAHEALHDVYEGRRRDLDELLRAVRPVDSQVGAVVLVGGRPTVLDYVGRPEVFASLLPRLAQGYALDALDNEDTQPDPDAAFAFLADAMAGARAPLPTVGIGRGFALRDPRLTGSGLEQTGELVQLSAFPSEEARGRGAGHAAIARPSRRRRHAA